MKIKNRKIIRILSIRSLRASGKRNLIAVAAIALTTVLFTTLFTIALSINTSYENYTFRQIGGYSHGAFKEVDDAQIMAISGHPEIKAAGLRMVAGTMTEQPFAKTPAEISYMDENNTRWSFIELSEGRLPEAKDEVIMDTGALELLGIEPKIGAKIPLTYELTDKNQSFGIQQDTFTLTGWWEYDTLCPVHFINVSKEYISMLEKGVTAKGGDPFRKDLNIMLDSSIDIAGTMEEVEKDLGYQEKDPGKENYIRKGVNWGYTAAQTDSILSPGTIAAMAAFLLLVIFTGYLIIYNIFQISVTGDIRYYGLLKTIGVTPRQLRRMIHQQALLLCAAGCPVGLILGYLTGYVLTPVVLAQSTMDMVEAEISTSPLIFVVAVAFSVITVLLSCRKPGKIASRVSPVEAAKYTEGSEAVSARKRRETRGAKIHQMAFANLGRNKRKTVLVIVSLTLAVVLLSVVYGFTSGFSMEKYLESKTCADFIVGKTDYFRFEATHEDRGVPKEAVEQIKESTQIAAGGQAWGIYGPWPLEWRTKAQIGDGNGINLSEEQLSTALAEQPKRGDRYGMDLQLEGLDASLLNKLDVLQGDLAPLADPNQKAIAFEVPVDDYGVPDAWTDYPKVGDKVPITWVEEGIYIDRTTGKEATEESLPEQVQYRIKKSRTIEYTVCALVTVPYQMSYRYSLGYSRNAIMETNRLQEDCGTKIYPLFYLFDTPNAAAETEAEQFLSDLTGGETSELMYESKQTVREEFYGFKQMFMILGGVLCGIVGLVGILNFFNGIMTGILSRRREFAMLQSIGMTGSQLRAMLICEGVFYAVGTILLSIVLTVIIGPLVGGVMEKMFWFYAHHFTLLAIGVTAPIFLILGMALPVLVYRSVSKKTIVERLREIE